MFALYGAYALAFWYGTHLFARHEAKSSGSIITALFSIMIGVNAFSELATHLGAFMRIRSAGDEMFKIIDLSTTSNAPSSITERTVPALNDDKWSDFFRQDINFRDVSFHYPTRPGVQALDNCSLTIPVGKTTALVGPSGSGKSTVVGLLLRWYDVSTGELSFGASKTDNIPIDKIRASIGLVQQVCQPK
jgi:ATP-binding cassette subfamily B (MDR/TAP) protein 1